MLKSELVEDETRIRHYSDDGHYIIQKDTGIQYVDAVDNLPCAHEYEESEEMIESVECEV